MDLRRQLEIARRWLPLFVVVALLSGLAGLGVSSLLPRTWEAKATLIVGQSLSTLNPDYSALLVSQRLSTTYASVATTRPVLERVIDKLGLGETPAELLRRVEADAPLNSTLLTIAARDRDAGRAAAIANAVAEELIAKSDVVVGRQTELQAAIEADLAATRNDIASAQAEARALAEIPDRTAAQQARLQVLEDRLPALRATFATLVSYATSSTANLLSVVDPATPPVEPVAPRVLLNAILAAVLGLAVAVGIVAVREYLDDTVKSHEDLAELVDVPVLGAIPLMRNGRDIGASTPRATLLHPRSRAAESYRSLRTNVEFAAVDRPVRHLLVTSPGSREGKTVTTTNLGIAFAQAGRDVILVDADLRRPALDRAFGLSNAVGLTTLLRGEADGAAAVAQRTEQEHLRVITTGPLPPNPAELLGSQRMRAIVNDIGAQADLVIYDSPPLEAVADAAIIASYADGVVYVVEAGRARRRAVRLGREALRRAGANVLGAVLNRVIPSARLEYSGYYDSLPEGTQEATSGAGSLHGGSRRPSPP